MFGRSSRNAEQRFGAMSTARVSWTMRVLVVNMFVLSTLSYPCRIFLLSPGRISDATNNALRFITPIPFCSFGVLSHCSHLFRVHLSPRDPLFDNIASVIATTMMLLRRGIVSRAHISGLQSRIAQLSSEDIWLPHLPTEVPQSLVHYMVAVSLFERIT